MASPKHPGLHVQSLPKLTDPNNVQEVYANHTVGLNYRDGMMHITFSVIRPRHSGATGPDEENVVAVRIALPAMTMGALVDAYGQLQKAMQMQQAGKPN